MVRRRISVREEHVSDDCMVTSFLTLQVNTLGKRLSATSCLEILIPTRLFTLKRLVRVCVKVLTV